MHDSVPEITLSAEVLQPECVVMQATLPASPVGGETGAQHASPFVLPVRHRWQLVVKRMLDVVVTTCVLVVSFPLFVLIALAILVLEGRPVFFRLDHIGENGRAFRSYKFRTMINGANALRTKLAAENEMSGPVFKMRNDPRVSRVGAFLRGFSLDELPQLWSVLKGDMSLVGPRPLMAQEYAHATPAQRQKLSVIPGITCLWQIRGRSEIRDFDVWVSLDLQYIREWSLWLDLKILLQTIPAVLTRRGAW